MYASPTTLRVPGLPYDSATWSGYYVDSTYPIFVENRANSGGALGQPIMCFRCAYGYVHASHLAPGLQTVTSTDSRIDTFEPDEAAVNQRLSFGDGIIYFTQKYGWVYMPKGAPYPGYEPIELLRRTDDGDDEPGEGNPPNGTDENGEETYEYFGDEFYTPDNGYGLPSTTSTEIWVGRGILKNQKTIPKVRFKMYFPRWQKVDQSTPYGDDYAPIDSPFPYPMRNRYFGSPRWTDQDGKKYIRSLKKTAALGGYYTYGDIYRNYKAGASGAWVIGVRDEGDWWEGDEPSLNTSVTFIYRGAREDGEDLTITFQDYANPGFETLVYLAEVARWM